MADLLTEVASACTMAGTVFGSSLVVATLTHLLTVGRAEKEWRKKKLEELFVNAATFKRPFHRQYCC
jgi:hypothetical protein